MRFLFFIFCIFASTGHCLDEKDISAASVENEPSSLIEGTVSAITGELYLFDTDLVIQGAEPITISRYYRSQKDDKWDFFPQRKAKKCSLDGKEYFEVKEPTGCKLFYLNKGIIKIGKEKWSRYELDLSAHPGLSNTSQGTISSQSNRKNNYLMLDSKEKFFYLHNCDGTVRCYKKIHKKTGSDAYHLISERLSNQHQIFYEYNDDNGRIVNIRTTNPDGSKTFATADFKNIDKHEKGKIKSFDLRTSDGRLLEARSHDDRLISVKSPDAPNKKYEYADLETHEGSQIYQLSKVCLPLDRYVQYRYYDRKKQTVADHRVKMVDDVEFDDQQHKFVNPDKRRLHVRDILAPIGLNGERTAIASIFYERDANQTKVLDSHRNQTIYFWNDDLRLTSIERKDPNGSFLNSEHYVWGSNTTNGNLICRTFFDSQNRPIYARTFSYDDYGNVLEETLFGNLSGNGAPLRVDANFLPAQSNVERYQKRFVYGKDDRHLLIRTDEDNQKTVQVEYLPNTNLHTAEFTGRGDSIQIRKFWEYDGDNILRREIIDDGSFKQKESLQDVSERLIREVTPKPDAPYLGMPWIIQEKYWDGSREVLLKKTVLTYTTGGKIAQKEVYDADNVLRYRLLTTYDEKGRPLTQTDPMGQTQFYQYDEIGNEIAAIPAGEFFRVSKIFLS